MSDVVPLHSCLFNGQGGCKSGSCKDRSGVWGAGVVGQRDYLRLDWRWEEPVMLMERLPRECQSNEIPRLLLLHILAAKGPLNEEMPF